jgi:hypothetical protein
MTWTHRWLGGIITSGKWNNFQQHNDSISPALVHELEEFKLEISYYIQKRRKTSTRLRSGRTRWYHPEYLRGVAEAHRETKEGPQLKM